MVRNDLCIQIAIEIGIEIAHHAAIADLILSKLISMPARRCGLAAMMVLRHLPASIFRAREGSGRVSWVAVHAWSIAIAISISISMDARNSQKL
jgi:hypothetical protein